MKPAALQILLALIPGDSHGYAVMQSIREQSGANLGTGSFYRHLNRLMEDKLVEIAPRPAGDDPRRGDYYRLSPAGRQFLAEEKERLAGVMNALDALRPSPRRGRP